MRHTIINIVIDYNSISFERQDTNIEFSGCSIWQEEGKHLRVFQGLLVNLNVQMNKSGWFPCSSECSICPWVTLGQLQLNAPQLWQINWLKYKSLSHSLIPETWWSEPEKFHLLSASLLLSPKYKQPGAEEIRSVDLLLLMPSCWADRKNLRACTMCFQPIRKDRQTQMPLCPISSLK